MPLLARLRLPKLAELCSRTPPPSLLNHPRKHDVRLSRETNRPDPHQPSPLSQSAGSRLVTDEAVQIQSGKPLQPPPPSSLQRARKRTASAQ